MCVVISHDCDLVYSPEDEPDVEYIAGRFIDAPKSGYPFAQSPHCLHIEMMFEGKNRFVELLATDKNRVRKPLLAASRPDPRFCLSADNLVVLQTWLAARYKRAALPDSLVTRLRPVRDSIAEVGKKNPTAIWGIFLTYEPDEELTSDNTPYEVWITIVYSTSVPDAQVVAEQGADKLKHHFEKKFQVGGSWKQIDVREIRILSDTEFTLRDIISAKQWRLEHLSMRISPPGGVV